jgi:hypothetical protein
MTFLRSVITLYLFDLSMIFSENRRPLFRIMLYDNFLPPQRRINARKGLFAGGGTIPRHLRCGP